MTARRLDGEPAEAVRGPVARPAAGVGHPLAGRLVRVKVRTGPDGLLPVLVVDPDGARPPDPVPLRTAKGGWEGLVFLPADTLSVAVLDARDGRVLPAAAVQLAPVGRLGAVRAALSGDPWLALGAVADVLHGRRRAARAKALAALLDRETPAAAHASEGWAAVAGAVEPSLAEDEWPLDLEIAPETDRETLIAVLRAGTASTVLLRTVGAEPDRQAVRRLRQRLAADDRAVAAYGDWLVVVADGRVEAVRALPAWSPTLARAGGLPVPIALAWRERLLAALQDSRPPASGADRLGHCLLAVSNGVDGRLIHDPVIIGRAPARPTLARQRGVAPARRPSVAALVLTRDQPRLLDLCLRGLLRETDRPPDDVIVGDNDSREAATAAVFDRWIDGDRVRRIACPGPFNFSAFCNRLAGETRADLLLFLNDDVAVLEPDWLDRMAAVLDDPAVGAVGARLLYPDGTLQHLGIVLGLGPVAGHPFQFLAPAHVRRSAAPHADLPREVSAVTGACLLVRRTVFEAIGGFDATHLPVAYNDVDLCLRIWQAGYRVVVTPDATLVHHESVSRRRLRSPEQAAAHRAEVAAMQARWGHVIAADPFYSPRLSRRSRAVRLAPFAVDPGLVRTKPAGPPC